jgi:hypothetical protein
VTSGRTPTQRVGALTAAGLLAVGVQASVGAQTAAAAPAPGPADTGWTTLGTVDGGALVACKTAVDDSPYGALWKVNVVMANGAATHAHVGSVQVRRGDPVDGELIHNWSVTVQAGQWSGVGTVYLSRIKPDVLSAGTGETNGQGSGGVWDMGFISYC